MSPPKTLNHLHAFSLVELLATLSVVSILLALTISLTPSFSQNQNEKRAVNTLITAFEKARVTALSKRVNTYIAFAPETFHHENYRKKAYLLLRSPLPDEAPSSSLIPISKWETLPEGIEFITSKNSILSAPQILLPESAPYYTPDCTIPAIQFSPTGSLSGNTHCRNLLVTSTDKPDSPIGNIQLSKFTGQVSFLRHSHE